MSQNTEIKLFGEQKIRTGWDETLEEWKQRNCRIEGNE
jgi:hypothetical protein